MKRINVDLHLLHFPKFRKFQSRKVSSSLPKLELDQKSPQETVFLLGQVLDTYPDIRTLRTVHSRIILEDLRCNSSLGVKLMRAYASLKDVASARKVFDEIPERNVIIINVMIRSYVNNGFYGEGVKVFGTMCGCNVRPDHYTFPCVLKACSCSGNIVIGRKIHGSATKVGLSSTLFVGNGLVSMYGKCGFLSEARLVLDEMSRRDVVSWNSLVVGYAQNQRFDDALEVCREMESVKISHDAGTMASLLPAVSNTTTENVMYVKDMFFKMGKKSLVSWNVMIGVYMKNAMPVEAVELYSRMEADGFEPDAVSITSVLPACGDTSALSLGKKIHGYIERKKLIPNLLLENALIDMYAKCGCLEKARDVFENMKSRDVVSWTAMISAYGFSGRGCDAVALFSKMQDSGLVPDSIAFVTTLAACSHAGLLEEGRSCFKLMTDHYKITPRLEHLACMVDLLGRAGKVKEAYRFIQDMSMEPNERVWGALLGACRVHSDTDIGLLAADKLFQLAPEQSGYYVLLSNIYAKAGRWEEVTNIRNIMKSKGLKKNPGASNVEVNRIIHTFLVGDRSHPQSDEIYRELDVLVKKMKELGYVPDSESALHDVEEEDKETHLAVHSEKLAIVFALMNTKEEEEDSNNTIRITKNLRICGDCHVAAKLISQITSREIIIRDTNRFHVFRFGVCSCASELRDRESERLEITVVLPMIESVMAVRLSTGFCSSTALLQYRTAPSSEEGGNCFHYASRRVFQPQRIHHIDGSGFLKYNSDYITRKHLRKNRTQATAEYVDSASDPEKQTGKSRYHPSEEIRASLPQNDGDSRLSPAETTRTIIEVNNKGTLMLTGSIGDGVHENILWPDIPYITDQNGNLYFQVKEDEDVMQSVTSENNYVLLKHQVIVGFDTMEMIKEMELMGLSDSDFETEDDESGDDDSEDTGEDEDEEEWVASNDPVDWMDQPSAGLAIQGLLSHILVEDYSDIQKKLADSNSTTNGNKDAENLVDKLEDNSKAGGDESEIDSSQDEKARNVVAFYKLEMIRIQLITAQGDQTEVEVEDVRKAQPDAIAHASAEIISRLEESGDKITEALKSLCWRHNSIQAEEVKLIGIDSLGFDLRLCAGAKIESLRFAFSTRATSEENAEGQIRKLLFPKTNQSTQPKPK
ncbi:unnamed protein product [Arabidopsis thaliana]|uniref:(thale cress) hypothetical protein n=1 Tax=Arabidopsis thaliana TaxID=3702 RepID=A0A7G2EVV2_ARATH|nr:unnamed protein product [Arabidopsis thaliana]